MSKNKNKAKTLAAAIVDVVLGSPSAKRPYVITEATIKDDFCHFGYELTAGVGKLNDHVVKGKHVIMQTLKKAFEKFNPHMAVIDNIFSHGKLEVESLADIINHEFTFLFEVHSFVIFGADENESIQLIGFKTVYGGSRIAYRTPRISLASSSSYKWYNELKEAADVAREEVSLYHEGNYIKTEEENEADANQQSLFDNNEQGNKSSDDQLSEEEFENAAI